jgi:hypothetical protein
MLSFLVFFFATMAVCVISWYTEKKLYSSMVEVKGPTLILEAQFLKIKQTKQKQIPKHN